MATGAVHVSVVDVGQGQCTFVEIYDTTGKLAQTLLFDCGSDKQSTETQTNLQYIADKVSSMDTPAFDCIVFSHSDKDHVYLMYDLLKKFASKPIIKLVWYGGYRPQYTKYGHNILDDLETDYNVPDSQIKSPVADDTGYDKVSKQYTKHFWESPDKKVKILPIKSNVVSDDPDIDDGGDITPGTTAEAKNRVSIVCGLCYAGTSYIICGDATHKTMAAINVLFSTGTTVFDKNNMTTLPHHGSRATGFAVPSFKAASYQAIAVVDTFAALIQSRSISISAYEKHRHPSLQLMDRFIPTITTPILKDSRIKGNYHLLVAYLDIDLTKPCSMFLFKDIAQCFTSKTNTFSTRYKTMSLPTGVFSYELGTTLPTAPAELETSGTAINGFASWKYQTQTNGNFLLGGFPNLSSALFTGATVGLVSGTELEATIERPKKASLEKKEQIKLVRKKTIQTRRTGKKTYRPVTNRNRFENRVKQYTT